MTKSHRCIILFYSAGELQELVQEIKGQLKKIAITSNNRKDKVFLGIDLSRQGFINKDNLRELCQRQHLPSDDAIVSAVRKQLLLGRNSMVRYG